MYQPAQSANVNFIFCSASITVEDVGESFVINVRHIESPYLDSILFALHGKH